MKIYKKFEKNNYDNIFVFLIKKMYRKAYGNKLDKTGKSIVFSM
jgi:hypothetical protein